MDGRICPLSRLRPWTEILRVWAHEEIVSLIDRFQFFFSLFLQARVVRETVRVPDLDEVVIRFFDLFLAGPEFQAQHLKTLRGAWHAR